MAEAFSAKPSYAINSQGSRHWDIRANNIFVEDLLTAYSQLHGLEPQRLSWLTASNSMVGSTYIYGVHPNSSDPGLYDGIWKHERLGGGSVVVPYVEEPESGQIYVGLLRQWRKLHNTQQPVLGVPRGFALKHERLEQPVPMTRQEVEEIHTRTAFTELWEEMYKGVVVPEMFHRLGPPINTNNADVDTSREGEGTYVYSIELPWYCLTPAVEGYLTLKEEFLSRQGIHEGIVNCHFNRLVEVLDMLDDSANPLAGCAFTEIAIARLARYLQRNGRQIV